MKLVGCVMKVSTYLVWKMHELQVTNVSPVVGISMIWVYGIGYVVAAVLYLMCTDLAATMRELAERGARFTEVADVPWGRRTGVLLPSGAMLGLYQPAHALAIDLT